MSRNSITTIALLTAVVAIGAAVFFLKNRENRQHPGMLDDTSKQDDSANITQADAEAKRLAEADKAKGGKSGSDPMALSTEGLSYGHLSPIALDATPQVKSAVEASLAKTHPERLTCAVLPAAFDAKKWSSDEAYRAEYLRNPEPARCYQSAQPGKGVHRIALACPNYIETLQGRPVTLSVRATPGMPVTFTSFDAAHFTAGSGNTGSQLTTQTCISDGNGVATATLVAPSGVIDDCRVIASCPVDAGLAKITVHVRLPALKAPAASASTVSASNS